MADVDALIRRFVKFGAVSLNGVSNTDYQTLTGKLDKLGYNYSLNAIANMLVRDD